jgi:hypothetical protein
MLGAPAAVAWRWPVAKVARHLGPGEILVALLTVEQDDGPAVGVRNPVMAQPRARSVSPLEAQLPIGGLSQNLGAEARLADRLLHCRIVRATLDQRLAFLGG